MLTEENFRFAAQAGCTHLIIHLADYYTKEIVTATNEKKNYGIAALHDPVWELENLLRLQDMAGRYGLCIYAIENFSPADWYDVLLDGPEKEKQMDYICEIIRNVGKAGIASIGYNFSLAGVWGHMKKDTARGGAEATCFDADELDIDSPVPLGQVWNMTYDDTAPSGTIQAPTSEELWDRLRWFLEHALPVSEEAGVELALHPDDPPMPSLRSTPRLVYQPELYQELIDMLPSPSNKLEFCMGSIQEMFHGDIYSAIDQYAAQKKISYVHFRNVIGKVPKYQEVFVDEGDIDMMRCLRLLKKHQFDGVLIPDHTPLMTCGAPWHAGMAYALGYMKAALHSVEEEK